MGRPYSGELNDVEPSCSAAANHSLARNAQLGDSRYSAVSQCYRQAQLAGELGAYLGIEWGWGFLHLVLPRPSSDSSNRDNNFSRFGLAYHSLRTAHYLVCNGRLHLSCAPQLDVIFCLCRIERGRRGWRS